MTQITVRARRRAALAAAFFALTGHAAQAGVVAMPQWGAAPGAARPAAGDAARCLELEEATGRGRGAPRFEMSWSRDASCHAGVAAAGNSPDAASPASSQGGAPAPSTTARPPVAPPTTTVAAPSPSAPPAPPAPPAPATSATAPTSATPPAPAPQPAGESAEAPSEPTSPPSPQSTPQRAAPEAPAPGGIAPSPEEVQGTGTPSGITSPANELTGISPPPISEVRNQPPGTIPEPSSLWLLALGVAAAWRARRRTP